MKKKINRYIILIIMALTTYLVLDYINLPSLVGLVLNNINIDVFGILFNTSIVLILYMISFHCIENKQNEKDANARDTVAVLIKNTYEKCLYTLQLLDNKTILCKYILPKIEWNKSTPENVVIKNFQILPFTSFDSIINLAISGHIDKAKLNEYLDIKERKKKNIIILYKKRIVN